MKTGDIVYLLYIGGVRHKQGGLVEAVIESVKKKYFTLAGPQYRRDRFEIETLLHDGGDYQPQYRVYLSRQEYDDSQELKRNIDKIKQLSEGRSFTLEQTRKILALIE